MKSTMLALAGLALAGSAAAQPAAYPKRIASPGGEVVIPIAPFQRAYDEMHYAPSRRAGDFLYISGVIAGPRGAEGRDVDAFKAQTRRAFGVLKVTLAASGASFADVVMINSFHVWTGPGFTGSRDEQFAAFSAVKDEVMATPYPAWTAVGTSGLLADDGIVEIQMIAYVPQAKP